MLLGGEALSRAELAAGPPKFAFGFADVTFSKISDIFGIMSGLLLQREFRSENRIHITNASLDIFDLMKGRKLLRSETNSQLLRNLNFCALNLHFFDTHVDARFPMLRYYC